MEVERGTEGEGGEGVVVDVVVVVLKHHCQ